MSDKKPSLAFRVFRLLLIPVVVVAGLAIFLNQPVFPPPVVPVRDVSSARLEAHVRKLSEEFAPRDYSHPENLNRCADYIAAHFEEAGGRVARQRFSVISGEYQNVLATWGPAGTPRIVVGAHYDSAMDTPGADDNASGVAGLIELAHLLRDADLPCQVELAAYSLEEPPFFGGDQMGSCFHVARLQRKQTELKGAIILEMIGYFDDSPSSQQYPAPVLHWMYPGRGSFVAVIGLHKQTRFLRSVKRGMLAAGGDLTVRSISAPSWVPGVDFSDHRNFWRAGLPAVMITDTAFYRNTAYHEQNDTADRLDYERMAQVVASVYESVIRLANE